MQLQNTLSSTCSNTNSIPSAKERRRLTWLQGRASRWPPDSVRLQSPPPNRCSFLLWSQRRLLSLVPSRLPTRPGLHSNPSFHIHPFYRWGLRFQQQSGPSRDRRRIGNGAEVWYSSEGSWVLFSRVSHTQAHGASRDLSLRVNVVASLQEPSFLAPPFPVHIQSLVPAPRNIQEPPGWYWGHTPPLASFQMAPLRTRKSDSRCGYLQVLFITEFLA